MTFSTGCFCRGLLSEITAKEQTTTLEIATVFKKESKTIYKCQSTVSV